MIESISAITLATHNMSRAVCFYRMLGFEIVHGGDDASFTSFRAGTNYLSISSPNRPSEIGLGGDVLSSTIPMLIPSMRASSLPATVQTLRHTTPNGASGTSISPTRMVTNLASLGHCDNVRPLTPWHLRQRACDFQRRCN